MTGERPGARNGIGARLRRLSGSLTLRVVLLSTVWAVLALFVIATIISTLFRQYSEREFDRLLTAHLYNLVGSVGASDNSALTGTPNLGDLRFTVPRSGWYWSVEPQTPGLTGQLSSLSLTSAIAAPTAAEAPFDREFRRSYVVPGLGGEMVKILEAELIVNDKGDIARFRVMGNHSELDGDVRAFNRQIYTYLSLLGLGLVAINVIAILLALVPLRRVSRALADVREGRALRIDGDLPVEIAPLAEETNALIESNRRIVERARTQVGNLAHSLKTPLAVLLNEGHALGGDRGRLMTEQARAMQLQVEHYLQRARIAAQRDGVVFRTPVGEVLTRMARVLRKLNPEADIELVLPETEIVFAGEKEDFEELCGNLLENALKWSRGKVRIMAMPAVDADPGVFELWIEDDGPGIPEDKAREALKRGRRLDETKPGTGLGLAIVADLVKEYEGVLSLRKSELGGLAAVVRLRAARS